MVDDHRWSSLPDEILENIVTSLDTDRNLLLKVSATTFDLTILSMKPSICSILDNLFTIFCSPLITNFSLQLPHNFFEEPCFSTVVDSWVHYLRARNLQHFKLQFDSVERSRVVCSPTIIFRLQPLVSLDLDICRAFTDNNSTTLPNLKKLKLGWVNCYRSLERILQFCPSLESLSLTIVDQPHQKGKKGPVLIAGENLNQLYIVQASQSTIEVMIDCPQLESFRYESNFLLSMRMLDTISHVKSLEIDLGYSRIWLLNDPIKTVFPNLTHLKLKLSQCEIFRAICNMLDCCPNLEILDLHFHFDFNQTPWSPEDMIGSIIEHAKQLSNCSM